MHPCTPVPMCMSVPVCPTPLCTSVPVYLCTHGHLHPCTYTPCMPTHPCTPLPHGHVSLHPYIQAPLYVCTHTPPATPEPLNPCTFEPKHLHTLYTGTRAPLYPVQPYTPAPHTHPYSLQQPWHSQHLLPRGPVGCRAATPSHAVPCDPRPRRYNYPLSSCSC